MTEDVAFSEAVSQCRSGWRMNDPVMDENLEGWRRSAMRLVAATALSRKDRLVWLPVRRPNLQADFENPCWKWTGVSGRWMKTPSSYQNAGLIQDSSHHCAAYDVAQDRMVGSPCSRRLAMICHRDAINSSEVQESILTDEQSFCPPGWVTHPLVLDSALCFRRFRTPQPLDWDAAEAVCVRYGGRLANAQTQVLRAALDRVLFHFNNRSGGEGGGSGGLHSWIGLRQISVRD